MTSHGRATPAKAGGTANDVCCLCLVNGAPTYMGLSNDIAPQAATRSDVLLALAALPVQDLSAYLQAMAETITRVLSVDTTGALILDAAGDALMALGPGGMTSCVTHSGGTDRVALSER